MLRKRGPLQVREEEHMRRYETILIVRPNIAEDEIEVVINRAGSTIEGDGGTIIRIDKWGLKKLAYLIKKESQGYYVYIDYAGIPASVSEIERIFRIDDKILKYLTVKLADSCDPEAIKEELASAEAAQTSAEDEAKEEKSSPSKATKAATEDEAKEKKSSASEATKAATEDEVKEEKASPSGATKAATENEVKEENASPSEEEQVD